MPEKKALQVYWTSLALEKAIEIKKYISKAFSEREVNAYLELLKSFETAISIYPALYPETSKKAKIRRAVLNKNLSVFYRIFKDRIEVLMVLDNRCDLSEW
jgi:plasmid stabilization system protein ParE